MTFNWHTPDGYFITCVIQSFWTVGGGIIVVCVIMVFSGICEIFSAFSEDIWHELKDLNELIVKYPKGFAVYDRIVITNRLYSIIELHSDVKKLALFTIKLIRIANASFYFFLSFIFQFNVIYNLILTAFFALSTPCIRTSLLNFNSVHKLQFDLKFRKW